MFPWIAITLFIFVALAVDLRFGASEDTPSFRSSLLWSIFWTSIGLAFAVVVLVSQDGQAATEYLTGFLIERSLSLDNLFVFAVLFTFFAVPIEQQRRLLVYGIVGAIVLRGAFILVGVAALDAFSWITYVLGALLALTAIKIARQGDHEIDPNKTLAMRVLRRLIPISDDYEGSKFTTKVGSQRKATPLLAALVMVAAFDLMFAIDSIPAILAITQDSFIVFAANAFSLLGMISLYFLLAGMLERFRYLNLALAAILAYVAAKLLLVDVWHPPTLLSLAVIALSLAVASICSVVAERRETRVLED